MYRHLMHAETRRIVSYELSDMDVRDQILVPGKAVKCS